MNTHMIAFNLAHKDPEMRKVFQDKRFRQAISLSINRKQVIDTLLVGQGEAWQGAPPKDSKFYNEKLAKQFTEYDVAQANKLLDEMGLTKKGSDGMRPRFDGKPLVINFEVANNGPGADFVDMATLLSKFAAAVGVNIIVKVEDRTLFYDRKAAYEIDAALWIGDGGMDAQMEPRWYIPYSNESLWAVSWADWYDSAGKSGEEPNLPEVKKALELYTQMKQEPNEQKQDELFKQVLQIAQENLWAIGISFPPKMYCTVRNDFFNVPKGMIQTYNLPEPGSGHPEQFFSTRVK